MMDPVSLNIISHGLRAVADEMAISLIRAAHSTILREIHDGATGILSRDGQLVAESAMIPVHVAGLSLALGYCLRSFPVDELEPDDAFLLNDPYSGGQHPPDFVIFTPLFAAGRVVGFAGTVAHKSDIGGVSAGLGGRMTELHHTGLAIPPIKFQRGRDWERGFLRTLLAANSRLPDEMIGDVNAQLAACRTAQLRFDDLVERYGLDMVLTASEELLDYSEQLMRDAIGQLPDGTHYGEDVLEADADEPQDRLIRVAVTVSGSELTADFSGTEPQVRGSRNSSYASTLATIFSCVRGVVGDASIPSNSGCYRPIKVHVPEGTVLNPVSPAVINARMNTVYRAYDALLQALAHFAPGAVVAPGHNSTTGMSFALATEQRFSVHADIVSGGNGASYERDGANACNGPLGDTLNVPAEAVELANPWLRVTSFGLVPDSGGQGEHRGGLAVERVVTSLADGVQLGYHRGRDSRPAPGIFGGRAGALGGCSIRRRTGLLEQLPSYATAVLNSGDSVILRSCGGGGYGPPEARASSALDRDLKEGYVSPGSERS